MQQHKKCIVVGGGFGTMAAALRARRKGYAVTLIDRGHQLGFMNNSTAMIDSMLKTCVYDPVKAYMFCCLYCMQ